MRYEGLGWPAAVPFHVVLDIDALCGPGMDSRCPLLCCAGYWYNLGHRLGLESIHDTVHDTVYEPVH